jgi:hypothetical protein
LKPLIKYPIILFLLLLIGYSQLFAHVYRGFSFQEQSQPTKKASSKHQTLLVKAKDMDEIYYEEEEEENEKHSSRRSLDTGSRYTILVLHECIHLNPLASFKGGTQFFKHFSEFHSYVSLNIAFSVFRI